MADYTTLDANSTLEDLLVATDDFDDQDVINALVDYLDSPATMGRLSISRFSENLSQWEKKEDIMLSLSQQIQLRSIHAYAYYRVVTDEKPLPYDYRLDIVRDLATATLNHFDNDRSDDTDALGKIKIPKLTGVDKFSAYRQIIENYVSTKLSTVTKKPLYYLCRGELGHAPIEDGDGVTNELELTSLIQPMAGPAFNSDNSAMWNVFFPTVEGTPAEQMVKPFKATQDFAGAWIKLLKEYANTKIQSENADRAIFIIYNSNLPDRPGVINFEQYISVTKLAHQKLEEAGQTIPDTMKVSTLCNRLSDLSYMKTPIEIVLTTPKYSNDFDETCTYLQSRVPPERRKGNDKKNITISQAHAALVGNSGNNNNGTNDNPTEEERVRFANELRRRRGNDNTTNSEITIPANEWPTWPNWRKRLVHAENRRRGFTNNNNNNSQNYNNRGGRGRGYGGRGGYGRGGRGRGNNGNGGFGRGGRGRGRGGRGRGRGRDYGGYQPYYNNNNNNQNSDNNNFHNGNNNNNGHNNNGQNYGNARQLAHAFVQAIQADRAGSNDNVNTNNNNSGNNTSGDNTNTHSRNVQWGIRGNRN